MFHYVYILRSEPDPARRYVGRASDLEDRLARHNAGRVYHTSKHAPWRIETAIASVTAQRPQHSSAT